MCGLAATGLVLLVQQLIDTRDDRRAAADGPVPTATVASVVGAEAPAPTEGSRRRAGLSPPASQRSPSALPSPSPSVTAGAAVAGSGRLVFVSGTSGIGGTGPLRRYRVAVEAGIGANGPAFAAAVQRTLADPRSWGAELSFRRVDSGPVAFTVVLASPATAQRLCRPLNVAYRYSCFQHGRAVINDARWRGGAPAYAGNLAAYRHYVVNHEVGHALGHGHEECPGAGRLAPVMMQQTKGVGACRPNPWPHPAT